MKRKIKIEIKQARNRNPLHNHPLLKKGGVHKKTNKAVRKHNKQSIKKEWAEPIVLQNIIRSAHSY